MAAQLEAVCVADGGGSRGMWRGGHIAAFSEGGGERLASHSGLYNFQLVAMTGLGGMPVRLVDDLSVDTNGNALRALHAQLLQQVGEGGLGGEGLCFSVDQQGNMFHVGCGLEGVLD